MKFRVFLLLIAISIVPLFADAQSSGAPRTFRELAVDIVDILSAATATVLAFAVVIFIWNIAKNMTTLGDGNKVKERNAFLLWGSFIMFVIVSIWGILGLLRNTLFQGDRPGISGEFKSIVLMDSRSNI